MRILLCRVFETLYRVSGEMFSSASSGISRPDPLAGLILALIASMLSWHCSIWAKLHPVSRLSACLYRFLTKRCSNSPYKLYQLFHCQDIWGKTYTLGGCRINCSEKTNCLRIITNCMELIGREVEFLGFLRGNWGRHMSIGWGRVSVLLSFACLYFLMELKSGDLTSVCCKLPNEWYQLLCKFVKEF